jgi:hydrogenase-4 component B
MGVLAIGCVLLGLGAPSIIGWLYQIIGSLSPLAAAAPGLAGSRAWLLSPGGIAQVSPLLLTLSFLSVVVVAFAAIRAHGLELRYADTWGCGRIGQTSRMEYTSSAFAEPLRRIFSELYRPTEDLSIDVHPQSRYFVHSITYTSQVTPWVEQIFYDPVTRGVHRLATLVRRVQAGSVHLYLLYVVAALLVALASAWWLK